MRLLWDRAEVRAGFWTFIVAMILLLPGVALFVDVAGHGLATAGPRWTAWVSSGGYLPWNVISTYVVDPRALLFTLAASIAAGIYIWRLAGGANPSISGGPKAAGKGEYGTAHWRAASDLARTLNAWRPASHESGVLVGRAGSAAWVSTKDEHTLLVGSTGSGKSRRVILPTIGVIGTVGKESMVLTDPKGELYAHTAEWLRNQGYEVVRFDLREPSRGQRWNPMAPVLEAMARGRMDQATAAARDIAHAITFGDEAASKMEPIWTQSEEALITATILGVAQGKPPNGDARAPWPKPEERTMASVYSIMLTGGQDGVNIDRWMGLFPETHPASRAYGPVRMSVEKTRASILTVTAASLSIFADSDIAWLTSQQDYDLAEVGRRPMAVFLVIPDERATRYPLATLYLQQTMQSLVTLADEHGGRLPVRVNFLLDEFANLPPIKDFDHVVTVARGRGMRLLLAVQDLAQLKGKYGDAAGTIKGNCSWLYLLTNDLETANEIAGKLGNYTTEPAYRSNGLLGGPSYNQQAYQQPNLMGRSLLYADEIMRWPEDEALFLQARHAPARLKLPDLSKWQRFFPHVMEKRPVPPPRELPSVPMWGFNKVLPDDDGSPPELDIEEA